MPVAPAVRGVYRTPCWLCASVELYMNSFKLASKGEHKLQTIFIFGLCVPLAKPFQMTSNQTGITCDLDMGSVTPRWLNPVAFLKRIQLVQVSEVFSETSCFDAKC